jgi:hypothetical protein
VIHEAADAAIEEIDLVQKHGLQRFGDDRRAPFVRAVMSDDEVDELL